MDSPFAPYVQRYLFHSAAFVHEVLGVVEGREQADITFPVGRDGSTRTMKGQDFLQLWLLPNFYFHVTTTYALLRHNGVPLGKRDFLLGAAAAQ